MSSPGAVGSVQKTNIHKKILEIMKRVEYLKKDGEVAYGRTRYNYLSEEKITGEIRKAMIEVGVVMYPVKMDLMPARTIQTKSGESAVMGVIVTFHIADTETGEHVAVQTVGEGADTGDKALYKAMTGAFKYAQRESFMIPTGDDPDQVFEIDDKKINNMSATITVDQAKKLFTLAQGDKGIVKDTLNTFGYKNTTDIKQNEYSQICKVVESAVKNKEPDLPWEGVKQ